MPLMSPAERAGKESESSQKLARLRWQANENCLGNASVQNVTETREPEVLATSPQTRAARLQGRCKCGKLAFGHVLHLAVNPPRFSSIFVARNLG